MELFGLSEDSTLTAVYGKLTAEVANVQFFGSIAGDITGSRATGSLKRAVGYLDVKSDGALNKSGGLVGLVRPDTNIQQVFAAGSMNAGNLSEDVGQMIGSIWFGSLTAENCYSGASTGENIPAEAVGEILVSSANFTKCYTRATNFVKEDDLSQVTFDTVYATTAQAGGKEDTSVKGLPDSFDLLALNGDGSLWTDQFDGKTYKYPMLAYPDSMKDMKDGSVSEADWFEFQTQANEVKQ